MPMTSELRVRSASYCAEAVRRRHRPLAASGLSLRQLRRILNADLERVPVGELRAAYECVDARVRVSVCWRGAELDRVLDEAHAAVVERLVRMLHALGWSTAVEATYSEFGERGSIDILAFHEQRLWPGHRGQGVVGLGRANQSEP